MYLFWAWVSTIVSIALPPVLVFSLAGRWDLWYVWAYIGLLVVLVTLADYRRSSDTSKADSGRAQRRPSRAFFGLSLLQWIIVGLDQRFGWSDVIPTSGIVAGLVIFMVGWGVYAWAKAVNPFFSPFVRIQADQRVISAGPYAILRHPGYADYLLIAVASPLALNSLLAFIPTIILVANIISVTAIEDQMLRDELAGYADYAAKVRYRLIPGVW